MSPKKLVVIGNGMTGYKFLEKFCSFKESLNYQITVFGEEASPAYDRVKLSESFKGKTLNDLTLAPLSWYHENKIALHIETEVISLNPREKYILTKDQRKYIYDILVLATGSTAFLPPIPGLKAGHYHFFRNIRDVTELKKRALGKKRALVIGGGLLGLEAAKVAFDLGLKTEIIECSDRLMARQLDQAGAELLKVKTEELGFGARLNNFVKKVCQEADHMRITLDDGKEIKTDLILISAGIRPRTELARKARLQISALGGIVVDSKMMSSEPGILAIGECASIEGISYGLVAPGYKMAEIAVNRILGKTGDPFSFFNSAKLKSFGVEAASFGEINAQGASVKTLTLENKKDGHYKKLFLSGDGKRLLGGILVGDCAQYPILSQMAQAEATVPKNAESLLFTKPKSEAKDTLALAFISSKSVICNCENLKKGDLVAAIRKHHIQDARELKRITRAGTGCGGCLPMLEDILKLELEKEGLSLPNFLCEHFALNRQELFIKLKKDKLRTFDKAIEKYGKGEGCEICKPTIASILASLWNEPILNQQEIQDTNDAFLANIQKDGTYSVVPRLPGGVVTPDQLIQIGQIAKKYGLYSKITGGQRIDLFGAKLDDLPKIWKELVEFGFESGHAYGKSLRTVKSCVGSTWCGYGMRDSLKLSVDLENRYKGLRTPHKLKGGVSGCTRECSEAISKDFGVIATDKGWNLYVCGNGGVKAQHGVLLAENLDPERLMKYLDRFLMYYLQSADRLMRTSTWLNQLPGGISHLKEVIVEDSLNLGETWEAEMSYLLSQYECEWKNAINNEQLLGRFQSFLFDSNQAS
ncbi:MAG: nitrite reductase large subunit NirB [Deltaproteobacteria bacterium]|nr:nitrite reductase large subunit NirB [Deltaproteobacteria bacterium]